MEYEKKGVAIGYSGYETPKILAIAHGMLLEKLLEIAEENNITIYKDTNLAEVLSVLKIGSHIPDNLFHAAAEVLAYCYKTNDEFKKKIDSRIN